MPQATLKVELIRQTPDPQTLIALAARLCYSPATLSDLTERIERRDQEDFIGGVIESGHHSVLEHASFTFAVEGVSRALLGQLTRHRIASFSVQSQRYVSMDKGFGYVCPPAIAALGQEAEAEYARQMETIQDWYGKWQALLGGKGERANEDARFVLPMASETRLLVTMNVRELRHFFALRCCNRAQWEIRALAREMLRLCLAAAPALFDTAGPPCASAACPEGKRSCGKAYDVRREIQALKENNPPISN